MQLRNALNNRKPKASVATTFAMTATLKESLKHMRQILRSDAGA